MLIIFLSILDFLADLLSTSISLGNPVHESNTKIFVLVLGKTLYLGALQIALQR
jgi:hypothetical protein